MRIFRTCGVVAVLQLICRCAPCISQPQPDNTSEDKSGCAPLVRPHYHFRHLKWSGIFPFEGGLIPDPHCLSSEPMSLTDSSARALSIPNGSYQIFDVNPFFNDSSSGIILLIHAQGNLFEYSLDFPKGKGTQAVLATPQAPSVRILPFDGKLAVLANFSGPVRGIYILDPPLKTKTKLPLNPIGSPQFLKLAVSFKNIAKDPQVKQQFCNTTNEFAAFYEKYAGSCGWTPEEYAANPIVHNYAEFWESSK